MKSTENRIRKAALELFSQEGFSSVTTKRIAAKAEISEVTLFRYYSTKRELQEDILEKNLIIPSLQYLQPHSFIGQWHSDINRFVGIVEQFVEENRQILQMLLKDNQRSTLELDVLKDFLEEIKPLMVSYMDYHYKGKVNSKKITQTLLESVLGIILNTHLIEMIQKDQTWRKSCDTILQAFYLTISEDL